MIDPSFWKGKRVFLTGHTGFKGSWMSLLLHNYGAEVHGYALPPITNPNLFELASVGKILSSNYLADITDQDNLLEAIKKVQPEIVIHMAAQPLVRYSYQDPASTFNTNVMGTLYLFEAVRKVNSVRVILNVTSDKCYENKEWIWGYRETDPMGGYDPYSCSKGCSELLTSAYRRSFFNLDNIDKHSVAIISARAGNVIGGGDWSEDRLVPDIYRALMKKEVVKIRSPNSIRPWQHVLEPLTGYLMLAQKAYTEPFAYSGGWNFGPNEEDIKSVSWVANKLVSKWDSSLTWEDISDKNKESVHEAKTLKLDINKAKTSLGWEPTMGLELALDLTHDWNKSFYSNENMRNVTYIQIDKYFGLKYRVN